VYRRPGCGFCRALLGHLDSSDLEYATVDIWDDPDGAAFVRSVANGNETVPTVVVGDRTMVNPSFRAVVAAANV
jgi:glutaredoxin-like protein